MFKASLTLGTSLALALAACGGSSSPADLPRVAVGQAKQVAKSAVASGPKLKVIDSDYGRILADGSGRALYLFTADTGGESICFADCAAAWPPWVVKSKPRAATGVERSFIGTTRRDDGTLQATYHGRPLYYYVGDHSPGEVKCQAVFEFGGYWYVVRPSGNAVR